MRRALASIPLTLLLAGCVAQAVPPNALEGSAWRFVSIDGAEPASSSAALSFDGDRIAATAGCNRMGGPWKIEHERLIAGPLVQTKMYCETLDPQEVALNALLVSGPELVLKGDRLTLRSHGHTAELVRTAPAAD